MKAVGPRAGSVSTLARRLQLFLALLAPLPVALLLTAAIEQYEDRLQAEAEQRLSALAKGAGHEIFRRLRNLEFDLALLEASEAAPGGVPLLRDRFRSRIELAETPGAPPPVPQGLAPLAPKELQRLAEGLSLVRIETSTAGRATVWFTTATAGSPGERVWAEIEIDWLWPAEALPEEEEGFTWLLLDASTGRVLAPSSGNADELLAAAAGIGRQAAGGLAWHDREGRLHHARWWTVPLAYPFGTAGFVALVSEPDTLSPTLATLRRTLLLVALAAVLLTSLLTLRRLRAEFEPLAELIRAHRRVAEGDLSARFGGRGSADVERLGVAFNEMTEQLQRQFHLLDATQEVATTALARQATEDEITAAFAAHVTRLVPGAELIIALTDRYGRLRRVLPDEEPTLGAPGIEPVRLLPPALLEAPGWSPLDSASWLPERLWGRRSLWRALRCEDRVVGAVGVLEAQGGTLRGIELEVLRGPTEQLALALSHVRSLADLERANWGALTALARAVDAKSSWTRGHSERVAEVAVALAEERGWTETEVRLVRRGALLHDVGKIGVPSAILDKPGRLTTGEVALLRTHVEKGAKILEPLDSFADILPIIWQHHERLNGSGYPRGLVGDAIDPNAALVAVADVFEALTAERPYRAAQDPEETLAYLVSLAGVEFELQSVAALERLRASSPRWPFPLRDLRARSVG